MHSAEAAGGGTGHGRTAGPRAPEGSRSTGMRAQDAMGTEPEKRPCTPYDGETQGRSSTEPPGISWGAPGDGAQPPPPARAGASLPSQAHRPVPPRRRSAGRADLT